MKRASQPSPSSRPERFEAASVLHYLMIMETLVLVGAMTLSGLLAIGGTRAVLGILLMAIVRDAASR